MPRRKYGHMVGTCPPTPKEKCRACRLGHECPTHKHEAEVDYEAVRKTKKIRFSGGHKGKRWVRKVNKGRD